MNARYNIGHEQVRDRWRLALEQVKEFPNVSLKLDRNKIGIWITINGDRRSKALGETLSFDGIENAIRKARLVSDKLSTVSGETELWDWYEGTILGRHEIANDQTTFAEAIAKVEQKFWDNLSHGKRERNKDNPNDRCTWRTTHGQFYAKLPQDKPINLDSIMAVINHWEKGTKSRKEAIFAMKKLARVNRKDEILAQLTELPTVITKRQKLQKISLDEFLALHERVSNSQSPFDNSLKREQRKNWLWAFSMQVVYGLRISEVWAILNLKESYLTEDGDIIPALCSAENGDGLIAIADLTIHGTTTKTGYRIARPLIPPSHPDLMEKLNIRHGSVPPIDISGYNQDRISGILSHYARNRLVDWNAPVTQTHAFRHLANLNGMAAGISQEVRAQSLGHSVQMNETIYKNRQATKTTIDLLTRSNREPQGLSLALDSAKRILGEYPEGFLAVTLILAEIYQEDDNRIANLLD